MRRENLIPLPRARNLGAWNRVTLTWPGYPHSGRRYTGRDPRGVLRISSDGYDRRIFGGVEIFRIVGFVWVGNFTGSFGWLDLVKILILWGIRSKQYGGSYCCPRSRPRTSANKYNQITDFSIPCRYNILQLVKSHHPLRYSDSDTHADVTRGTSYNKILLFH